MKLKSFTFPKFRRKIRYSNFILNEDQIMLPTQDHIYEITDHQGFRTQKIINSPSKLQADNEIYSTWNSEKNKIFYKGIKISNNSPLISTVGNKSGGGMKEFLMLVGLIALIFLVGVCSK